MEPCEPDWGRRREGLAVVFLLSLSDSLSRHTTSYRVSELFFLSFCFICFNFKKKFSVELRLLKGQNSLSLGEQTLTFVSRMNRTGSCTSVMTKSTAVVMNNTLSFGVSSFTNWKCGDF